MSFETLGLMPELTRALSALGYETPTAIQTEAIPLALAGHDLMGGAQTGTGKTAAFLISIITQLLQTPPPKERYMGEPRALIIAPTRELVVQIAKDAADLTKYTGLNVMQFVGGMDFDKQLKALEARHCDILVATPGRLLDFNQRGEVVGVVGEIFQRVRHAQALDGRRGGHRRNGGGRRRGPGHGAGGGDVDHGGPFTGPPGENMPGVLGSLSAAPART